MENSREVPVLVLIFNRKEISVQAMQPIRAYKPHRLYIAADGPRASKSGEKDKCEQTRKAVLECVDWPCDVHTLFRDENLGCADAVNSAVSWFFEHEEFGIVCEDDIVFGQDFFRLCEELGERYRNDDRIMSINSQFIGDRTKSGIKESYVFSSVPTSWGWASWRRAWAKMDMSMNLYPSVPFRRYVKAYGLFRAFFMKYYYWRHDYRLISSGGSISSWATRWCFNVLAHNGLAIVPTYNLSLNEGFTGTDGAHYTVDDDNLYDYVKMESLPVALVHPEKVEADKRLRVIESRDFLRIRIYGLLKKLRTYKFRR